MFFRCEFEDRPLAFIHVYTIYYFASGLTLNYCDIHVILALSLSLSLSLSLTPILELPYARARAPVSYITAFAHSLFSFAPSSVVYYMLWMPLDFFFFLSFFILYYVICVRKLERVEIEEMCGEYSHHAEGIKCWASSYNRVWSDSKKFFFFFFFFFLQNSRIFRIFLLKLNERYMVEEKKLKTFTWKEVNIKYWVYNMLRKSYL